MASEPEELSLEEIMAQNDLIRAATTEAKTQISEHQVSEEDRIRRAQLMAEQTRLLAELSSHQATAVNQGAQLTGVAAMRAHAESLKATEAATAPEEDFSGVEDTSVVETTTDAPTQVTSVLPLPGGAS